MKQAKPEEVTVDAYNAMIHVCTQAADMQRAEEYFKEMEEKGFEPTVVTYNLIINVCARNGDSARAEDWLVDMIGRDLQPNLVTLGTLCKCFARHGEVDKINGIISSLERTDTPPNEYFYASLICACGACDPPDLDQAERAFSRMVSLGLWAQSVKRVLRQVLGRQRSQHLLDQLRNTNGSTRNTGTTRTKRGGAMPDQCGKGKGRGGVLAVPVPPGKMNYYAAGQGLDLNMSDFDNSQDNEDIPRVRPPGPRPKTRGWSEAPTSSRSLSSWRKSPASNAAIAIAAPWLLQPTPARQSYRHYGCMEQPPFRAMLRYDNRYWQHSHSMSGYPPPMPRYPPYMHHPWQPTAAWVHERQAYVPAREDVGYPHWAAGRGVSTAYERFLRAAQELRQEQEILAAQESYCAQEQSRQQVFRF